MANQHQQRNQMQQGENQVNEFDEKVVQISRVSKKTKGGNKMGFSILMVVGDRKGRVGVGLGKAGDVLSAMRKGVKKAKKKLISVPLDGTTIPFALTVKKGASRIMLKPAPKGSGVIAGGPVRAVVEAAGIRDISSKILGTTNQASNVYATFDALKRIETIVKLKGIKLKSIAEIETEEAKKMQELQEKAKKTEKAPEVSKEAKVEDKTEKSADKATKPAKKPVAKKESKKKELSN
ncbi:MAG TPA: 30S ribosomal protein S5 [Vitreimonas sp.]|nr:30S ribosomal protein S5 [Vitreimonas sp.]